MRAMEIQRSYENMIELDKRPTLKDNIFILRCQKLVQAQDREPLVGYDFTSHL